MPESTPFNALLDELLSQPVAGRDAWIDGLAARFDDLKPRLRKLAARAGEAEAVDFLGVIEPIEEEQELPDHAAGDVVGAYRLLRLLGHGGMGSVWLAERIDGLVNRHVALKLPHVVDGSRLAERMARERDILATLTHPHIARLYDAGLTPAGEPFLALEYVDGVRLDEYCKQHAASVNEKLRLFSQVAAAVAYAHANLIVHRDLKPANILVTASGEVRLLDFGVAKILDAQVGGESQLTRVAGVAMTPDYASPEQIKGETVTIATDVYSLGVVLYELLTERKPYKVKDTSRRALEDSVLAVEPDKPGLHGDLDTIVLKALKKSPAERYATVGAFADDLERFSTGRPVLAQPDRWSYRLRRFVGRNRIPVAAATAVLLAVLIGAGTALWQARVARSEQQRAEEVKRYIGDIFRDADPFAGQGNALSAADLLKQAWRRVDALPAANPAVRVELLNLIGAGLINLGDTAAAEAVAKQALAEAAALPPDHPLGVEARLLDTQVKQARGQTPEMRSELNALLPIVRANAQQRPEDLVRTLEAMAHLEIDAGNYEQAIAAAREAFDLASTRLGTTHPRTLAVATVLAESHLYGAGSRDEALEVATRMMKLVEGALEKTPRHPRVIETRHVYGRALGDTGQIERAMEEIEHALRDADAVYGPLSPSAAFMLQNLARYQRSRGDLPGALRNTERALDIQSHHAQRDSFAYASGLTSRGTILLALRRAEPALTSLTEAATTLEKLFGPTHEEVLIARFNRALALGFLGRSAEARAEIEPVLAAYRANYSEAVYYPYRPLGVSGTLQRLAGDFAAALATQDAAVRLMGPEISERGSLYSKVERGLLLVELGRHPEALAALEPAYTVILKVQQLPTPQRAETLLGMGRAQMGLEKYSAAVPLLEQAQAIWRDLDPQSRGAAEAEYFLARCYSRLGRNVEAARLQQHALPILSRSPLPGDAQLVKRANVLR